MKKLPFALLLSAVILAGVATTLWFLVGKDYFAFKDGVKTYFVMKSEFEAFVKSGKIFSDTDQLTPIFSKIGPIKTALAKRPFLLSDNDKKLADLLSKPLDEASKYFAKHTEYSKEVRSKISGGLIKEGDTLISGIKAVNELLSYQFAFEKENKKIGKFLNQHPELGF